MPDAANISLTVLTTLECPAQLWQIRLNRSGTLLAAPGYDATILRWAVQDTEFRPLAPLEGHHGWVQSCDFDNAGHLFTADSWGELSCWQAEAEAAQRVWSLPAAHAGWIRSIAVNPSGDRLATAGNDSVVRIWNTADGQALGELTGHEAPVFCVCWHPDGSLASGDLLGAVRHWDVANNKLVRQMSAASLYRLDKIQQCGGARVLSFDAAGKRLLVAGQKNPGGGFANGLPAVLVFDWERGEQTQEMQFGGNDDGFVYDAQFHPAGFVMAVSCAFPGKGHLCLWRPGDDKPLLSSSQFANGRTLCLDPAGRLLRLVSVSTNLNGRGEDPEYRDGTSKIELLKFEGLPG